VNCALGGRGVPLALLAWLTDRTTVATMFWPVAAALAAVATIAAAALVARRRRPIQDSTETPPVVFDRALGPQSMVAWLDPTTKLPDGWEERVTAALADDPAPPVGQLVWNRTASRLGLRELAQIEQVEDEPESDDAAYLDQAPTMPRRRSFLVRRRLAGLPDPVEDIDADAVPQHKPWSVRGGYVDVDWRALDLPEPIPDDFVR
jgi:hypothetical protein